ncbi:MAG: hypothetical protein ACOCX3_02735 [Chloroflexota bacterium]
MSRHQASEVKAQNLLDLLTRSVLVDDEIPSSLLHEANANLPDAATLITLIRQLREILVPQQPSDRFMKQLKRDLIGQQDGFMARIQSMPWRVQVATGVAATIAGLMWVASRREQSEELKHEQATDMPALQQQS